MADPKNFLLDSDYPMDKIVYMTSGSFTYSAAPTIVTFAHNLSFAPLVVGTYSFNSDFSTSRMSGIQVYGESSKLYVDISANATNIQLIGLRNSAGADVTVYYRIFGFMPSDVNDTASSTVASSSNFIVNTDYNYAKLFEAGKESVTSVPVTITHNLGYKPKVDAWHVNYTGDYLMMHNQDSTVTGTPMGPIDIKITDTTIVFTNTYSGTISPIDVHYRIYI